MPIRQVCAVAYQLGLRGVQTYDDQPPTEDPFPFAHIPAFRVKDKAALDHIRQFVDAAATLQPDVTLLDIGMPRLNGYEAARRIRQQPRHRGLILLALNRSTQHRPSL